MRARPGDLLAGLGGLALLVALFVPWYGPPTSSSAPAGTPPPSARNAWQVFSVLDVVLGLVALGALAVCLLNAIQRTTAAPVAAEVVALPLAVGAALVVGVRLAAGAAPSPNLGALRPGAWLGLAATALCAVGTFLAMKDDRPRAERWRTPRPVAAPAEAVAGLAADEPGGSADS